MQYISFPGLGIEPFHIDKVAFTLFGKVTAHFVGVILPDIGVIYLDIIGRKALQCFGLSERGIHFKYSDRRGLIARVPVIAHAIHTEMSSCFHTLLPASCCAVPLKGINIAATSAGSFHDHQYPRFLRKHKA